MVLDQKLIWSNKFNVFNRKKVVTREKKEHEYILCVFAYTSYLHFLHAENWCKIQ